MTLKYPSGWFAAGREVRLAATLLSDAAFKLFVWVCLHAERNSGRGRLAVAELAGSLQKPEGEIKNCIQELVRCGVFRLHESGAIEIQEPFWPYKRNLPQTATDGTEAYVAAIRRLFLRHSCVSSCFSAADERLAVDWRRRGVSLQRVERAIYLGVTRKYAALINNGKGTPITALSYFENLIEEVELADVSPSYWQHVMHRAAQLEHCWRNRRAARPLSTPTEETK